MNRNYRTQGSPEPSAKEQANAVIAQLSVKGRSTVEEAFAEFYLKAQQHAITAGDFSLVVRALYQQLNGLQHADKTASKEYSAAVQQCTQVILSANMAYTDIDQPRAFALHNSVVNRLSDEQDIGSLLRTFGTFREERYQNTGRPSGAHDVHRGKTRRSWVTAPSGD